MKMLELISFLRSNILDDTGGQGVDWSSHTEDDADSYQLRWSNEELVSNINEAINQVYRRAAPARDTYQITTKAGKYIYDLPKYILRLVRARLVDGDEIPEVTLDDVWNKPAKMGVATGYITDYVSGTVQFHPIPNSVYSVEFMVNRLPKVKLDLYSSEDVELKDEFVLPMLHYAASLCYMKDEANSLDPQRSQYFMNLFDREFPFTSSYSTIRKSRTANRPVKYGGL
jgi:hypothetical protein